MRTLHCSKIIITDTNSTPIINGGLLTEGSRIISVGRIENFKGYKNIKIIDHGDSLICPGFINLHCHLLYSDTKKINSKGGLFPWLQELVNHKIKKRNAREAIQQLTSSGTTTVVENTPDEVTINELAKSPLRAIIGLEVFGSDEKEASNIFKENLKRFKILQNKYKKFDFTFSPHATYDVSVLLWQHLIDWSKKTDLFILTHLDESPQEKLWWNNKSGPALEFWKQIKKLDPKLKYWRKYKSSTDFLIKNKILNKKIIATHLSQASCEDLLNIKKNNLGIIHCPRSNSYLNNGVANLNQWNKLGLVWGIGTDSIASNKNLDLLEEIRFTIKQQKKVFNYKLSEKDCFEAITSRAAKIISKDKKLGSLKPSYLADFLVYKVKKHCNYIYKDPYKLMIWGLDNKKDLKEIWINGKKV